MAILLILQAHFAKLSNFDFQKYIKRCLEKSCGRGLGGIGKRNSNKGG